MSDLLIRAEIERDPQRPPIDTRAGWFLWIHGRGCLYVAFALMCALAAPRWAVALGACVAALLVVGAAMTAEWQIAIRNLRAMRAGEDPHR